MSHLDLSRAMEFALRRARVPMAFSGGFHPRPKIRFESALPLGWESEQEWMWVDLESEYSARELKNRLLKTAPPGVKVLSVQPAARRTEMISQRIYRLQGLQLKENSTEELLCFGETQTGLPCVETWPEDMATIFCIRSARKNEEPVSLKKALKRLNGGKVPTGIQVLRLREVSL
jgi:hypothetical protein